MSEPGRFLGRIVAALDAAGVPHMLAGSFASGIHGAPRATQDIDVARDEFKRRGQFNVIDATTSWKADLIFRKARPFSRSEIERRIPMKVLGVDAFVATAEDTVLAKLEWAKLGESERQLRDVRGILDVKGDALDREYTERWPR